MKRNQIYQSIKSLVRPRSNFDLSRTNRMSLRMAQLVPSLVEPALPGDTFRATHATLCRFAPMTAPIMADIDVKTFYFNVPMRLLFNDWEDFITGGETGTDDVPFPRLSFKPTDDGYLTLPNYVWNLLKPGTLYDYIGFPTVHPDDIEPVDDETSRVRTPGFQIDCTPLLAYQLIYNEYFRDQNLDADFDVFAGYEFNGLSNVYIISKYTFPADAGDLSEGTLPYWLVDLLTLRTKCWEKNYFTSALPSPQRGVAVQLPLNLDTRVTYIPQSSPERQGVAGLVDSTGDSAGGFSPVGLYTADAEQRSVGSPIYLGDDPEEEFIAEYNPADSLKVLTDQGNADIVELRRSLKLQEFLEAMMRGGSRYIEQMKTMFGVSSSDARLQRPEFLGATTQPVIVSEVLQTSETAETPQGTMSGRGVSAGHNKAFSIFHEEHSLVVGLVCVMPRYSMYNGLPRKFHKFDKFDYYWHQFDHIGEQEIKLFELYSPFSGQADYQSTFGYAPRYAEYKSSVDEVHGEFKNTLQYWHMGNEYDSVPRLNSAFVRPSREVLERPFAVRDGNAEQVYLEMYFNFTAKRMMSRYSTPCID